MCIRDRACRRARASFAGWRRRHGKTCWIRPRGAIQAKPNHGTAGYDSEGLRLNRLIVAALFLVACSTTTSTVSSSSRITYLGDTKAADLRLRLNLLLSEQVMIIAKESEAAAFQTQALTGYAHLLDINGGELALIVRNAFGQRSAEEFYTTWQVLNRDLVEYGIGLVTHNQTMSDKFAADLTNNFVPHFAQVVNRLMDIDTGLIAQLMTQQTAATKSMIEDVAGSKFSNLYADLHAAYASTAGLADTLAQRFTQKFPDKFPGVTSHPDVDLRVSINSLLQEHSHVATMATNATVTKRDSEKAAAMSALAVNTDSLDRLLPPQVKPLWTQRDAALLVYATTADASAKQTLTDVFVTQFSTFTRVARPAIAEQVNATIKVGDDQRGQAFKVLADDDRAAATTMQPIGDAIAVNPALSR